MASFGDSLEGGLVVNTGGYSGGMVEVPSFIMDAANAVTPPLFSGNGWIMLAYLIVMTFIIVWLIIAAARGGKLLGFRSGFGLSGSNSGLQTLNSGPNVRFFGRPSQPGLEYSEGFRTDADKTSDLYRQIRSPFINSREQPYFPDVTNRVLRMENREKEAVRALGKINQERLRRASVDSQSTTPLPWEAFWKEWKQTHPLDGEDIPEGMSNFERQMEELPIY